MAPSIALVHDYLTQRGGAERVALSLTRAFPGAPLHTSLYEPAATFPAFAAVDVRPLPLNRLGPLRRNHRLALPLLAPAFSRLRVDADVVICSSSGWAHGARVTGRKIVYCHTPARWLYQPGRYLRAIKSILGTGLFEETTQVRLRQYAEHEFHEIAEKVHRMQITPSGTEGYKKAEVTAGGVATAELSSQTMEVKRLPGLYFIGEVVDVTGELGGYNFQWAWASGHAASQAV